MKRLATLAGIAFCGLILAACSTEESSAALEALGGPTTYLLSSGGALPANFSAAVARNGDTLNALHAEAGFASVTTRTPEAYAKYADLVVQNVMLVRDRPDMEPVAFTVEERSGKRSGGKGKKASPTEPAAGGDVGDPPASGDDDVLFDRQWGHDAVNAPEAWNAGVRGAGVRVAVIDGGFSLDHPDLAPNVNHDLSMDFTGEGLEYAPNEDDPTGIFSHGNHVAGTIAAADNGFGTIGVAPEAELVLVKVLGNVGSGTFEDVVEGILYAADVDADVINMSLGADIPQGVGIGADGIAALRQLMNRTVAYAAQRGATVIVAAGNDGRDLDKDRSVTVYPAAMPQALAISALGPEGWGADPATDLETLAVYSNYGLSGIDFGAPGGDYELVFSDPELAFDDCTVSGATRACYVWDFVFSTGAITPDGAVTWYWSVGTSMAAPHAAGVAALIISENGGSMTPAEVKTEMARRAADLGKDGKDAIYGHGAVRSGY